jgi:hypothetical protein
MSIVVHVLPQVYRNCWCCRRPRAVGDVQFELHVIASPLGVSVDYGRENNGTTLRTSVIYSGYAQP